MPQTLFNKILIIGKTWPESSASAAGIRTQDLITLLKQQCQQLHFACAAQRQDCCDHLPDIQCHDIQLNDSNFDSWIKELNPDLVMFDRFMTEEQFGWRVAEQCPDAIRLLDTSDFHGLRFAREKAIKTGSTPDIYNDISLREYAAIARCDLSIFISQVEIDILKSSFLISEELLYRLPFLQQVPNPEDMNTYDQRQNVVFVGGFKHAPNVDAVQWLYNDIWPIVRKKIPDAECHIYGPYAPHSITQLHQPKKGFLIKNRVDDIRNTMSNYRLNLATLRYGAGNKGKVIDGWVTGTPTIMTPIAAEGMYTDLQPNLDPAQDAQILANQIIDVYQQPALWTETQNNALKLLAQNNDPESHTKSFSQKIARLTQELKQHRHKNMLGRLLSMQQFKANEYMSRWIEAKNKLS